MSTNSVLLQGKTHKGYWLSVKRCSYVELGTQTQDSADDPFDSTMHEQLPFQCFRRFCKQYSFLTCKLAIFFKKGLAWTDSERIKNLFIRYSIYSQELSVKEAYEYLFNVLCKKYSHQLLDKKPSTYVQIWFLFSKLQRADHSSKVRWQIPWLSLCLPSSLHPYGEEIRHTRHWDLGTAHFVLCVSLILLYLLSFWGLHAWLGLFKRRNSQYFSFV